MSAAVTHVVRSAPLGRELRAMLLLAGPIVVGKLSLMGQNTLDVLLAGHLSAEVLGAVALGGSVWWLAQMALSGVLLVVSPFVSQWVGAGQRHQVATAVLQSLWIALGASLGLAVVVWWGGPALVDLIGVAPELRPDVARFLHAIAFAAPAFGVLTVSMGLCEGLSMPRASMVAGMLGLLLLGPLGYAVMYGRWGMPALGAQGSAIANVIVMWAQACGLLAWIAWSGRFAGLGWRTASWWPNGRAIAAQLRIGLPIALSQLMETSLFSGAALIIGRFGTAAAASNMVALNVGALTFMVPLGLAFATTVRVGLAVGRGDRTGVRIAGFCGIGLAAGAQGMAAIVILSMPHRIAQFYTDDPAVLARATVLLRLTGLYQIFDGIQVSAIAALRGLKDTRIAVVLTGLAYWGIGMPIAVICAYPLGLETPGVWVGLVAALAVAAILLAARFHRVSRA